VERWLVKTGVDPLVGSVKLDSRQSDDDREARDSRQHVDQNLPEDQRFPPVETNVLHAARNAADGGRRR
jgi:hypothetical protein